MGSSSSRWLVVSVVALSLTTAGVALADRAGGDFLQENGAGCGGAIAIPGPTGPAQTPRVATSALDQWSDTPVLVLSSLGEVLVQNRFAEAL